MPPLFFAQTDELVKNHPTVIDAHKSAQECGTGSPDPVGCSAVIRRARYMARFIYWTVRHRSTANVRWVLAYEGFTW